MKKICLQVGHMNASTGDSWMKPLTGAPKEQEKNRAISFRTAELLRMRGFEVKVTDANGYKDPTVTNVDWDMFLAVHCDADSADLSGGFTDFCDPSYDEATIESQRIADKIAEKFYPESGIVYRPNRRGQINVRQYYFWGYLTMPTPCVLIEMGESIDPHDSVILNDTERCAKALTRGICLAFGISFDQPSNQPPSTEQQICIPIREYEELKAEKKRLSEAVEQLSTRIALKDKECQAKLQAQRKEMVKKFIDLASNL